MIYRIVVWGVEICSLNDVWVIGNLGKCKTSFHEIQNMFYKGRSTDIQTSNLLSFYFALNSSKVQYYIAQIIQLSMLLITYAHFISFFKYSYEDNHYTNTQQEVIIFFSILGEKVCGSLFLPNYHTAMQRYSWTEKDVSFQ